MNVANIKTSKRNQLGVTNKKVVRFESQMVVVSLLEMQIRDTHIFAKYYLSWTGAHDTRAEFRECRMYTYNEKAYEKLNNKIFHL